MATLSRRELIQMSAPITIGLATAVVPVSSFDKDRGSRLKLMVVGAHPDDPETGCGGVMAKYAKAGHDVVAVYLTRGEGGIPGKTNNEAAEIRTKEAKEACEILGARPVFVGQIDGDTKLDAERYNDIWEIVKRENPDIVLTHWPIDTHRDHRICSLLVYDTWLKSGHNFSLYYFEVMTGTQSQNFNPTDFVDITDVIEVKHKACFTHLSQNIKEEYNNELLHGKMEVFRGMEGGFKYAEAFVRQIQSKKDNL